MKWPNVWPFTRTSQRSSTWKLSELQSWAEMGIGSGPTAAGITITPELAMSVPSVYAAVSVLAEDVARTPIKLRERTGPDTYVDAVDHSLWEILHDLANPETAASSLKDEMMRDLLQHERAYAEVVRHNGRVVSLWRLDPQRVRVDRDGARRKRWHFTDDQGKVTTWTFDPSMPPVFELRHPSPLRHCRDLIATAIALQRYTGKFFANGARPGGVITDPNDLDDDQVKQLRDQFSGWHAGTENVNKLAVLASGRKFEPVTQANDSSQLNETATFLRTQIAGAFRLAPYKLGDLSEANYSNVEALAIEHATSSLDRYFQLWESSIRRDLLTNRQYGRYDVLFDRSALIRSDIQRLYASLARGRDAGFLSANDCRRALGMNPIPSDQGGDLYLANANLAPLGQASGDENGSPRQN